MGGKSFDEWVSENNPLPLYATSEKSRNYIIALVGILKKIAANLSAVYDYGYVLCDIAPDNIIIGKKQVSFIDLENVASVSGNSQFYVYTKGFGDLTFTPLQNVIFGVSSLLLYGIVKHNIGFNEKTPEQILSPYIRRYPDMVLISEAISNIRACSNIAEMIECLDALESAVDLTEWQRLENPSNFKKYSIFQDVEKMSEENISRYISEMEDNLAIATGMGGVLLAKKYMNMEVNADTHFDKVAYRCLGLYYGVGGQLFLAGECNRISKELISMVADSDYMTLDDFSVSTGITGLGIGLVRYALFDRSTEVLSIVRKIAERVRTKAKFSEFGIENGMAGGALFLLYTYKLLGDKKYFDKAKKWLNLCESYIRVNESRLFTMLVGDLEIASPYIKDGVIGIVIALMTMDGLQQNFSKKEFVLRVLKKYEGSHALSPFFYEGSAGFVYAYLMAHSLYGDDVLLRMSRWHYSDILSAYDEGIFFEPRGDVNVACYLYGGLSTALVAEMLDKENFCEIFPFVNFRGTHE